MKEAQFPKAKLTRPVKFFRLGRGIVYFMSNTAEAVIEGAYSTPPTQLRPHDRKEPVVIGVEKLGDRPAAKRPEKKQENGDELRQQRLRKAWKEELGDAWWKNPDARATVEAAVKLGLAPDTVTSKARKDEKEFTAADVVRNAMIADDALRIKKAEKILGRRLNDKEQEAILNAHYVGINRETGEALEKGKDEEHDISVFNKSVGQLKRTVEEMEKAVDPETGEPSISREEQRMLIEAGIAAPPVTPYAYTDTDLQKIVALIDSEAARLPADQPFDPRFVEDQLKRVMKVKEDNILDPIKVAEADRLLNEFARQRSNKNEGWYTALNEHDFELLKMTHEDAMRDWVNYRMTVLYTVARNSDVSRHTTFETAQRAFEEALRFKGLDLKSQEQLTLEFQTRVKLLIMRSAMDTKNIESIVPAASGLKADGLLNGYLLENGHVAALVNRIDELMEDKRIKQEYQHLTNDIIAEVEVEVLEENLEQARNGRGDFRHIYDVTNTRVNDQINNAIRGEGIFREHYYDILRKRGVVDPFAVDFGALTPSEQTNIRLALRDEVAKAEITNAYRTAYDIAVSNQRLAVLAARCMMVRVAHDEGDIWKTDPFFPFTSFNVRKSFIDKWNYERVADFELYEEITKSLVREYMRDNGYKEGDLNDHEKTQLGNILFRDMLAPGDFLSSTWRMQAVMDHMYDYFGQKDEHGNYIFAAALAAKIPGIDLTTPGEAAEKRRQEQIKAYTEEFALFVWAPGITQAGVAGVEELKKARTAEERTAAQKKIDESKNHWKKIREYRPEEVIKLLREKYAHGEYDEHHHLIKAGESEKMQIAIFGNEHGYDHFKEHFGYGIRMVREKAFRGEYLPAGTTRPGEPEVRLAEQVDFTNLTPDQRRDLDAYTHGNAAEVIRVFGQMQEYITDNKIVPTGDGKSVIERDTRFAEVYNSGMARARVVDDALLGTLQKNVIKGKPKLSDRMGGGVGYEGDSYARCVGDISAGEGGEGVAMMMINGLQSHNMDDRFKNFQAAAKKAATYAGLDGTAKILYHSEVSWLLAGRIPTGWDILGIEEHPLYRKPINRLQEILGPHADAYSKDRLRHELDIIETSLEQAVAHGVAKIEAQAHREGWSAERTKAEIARLIEDKKKLVRRAENLLGVEVGDMMVDKWVKLAVFLGLIIAFETVAAPLEALEESTGIEGGGGGGGGGHGDGH